VKEWTWCHFQLTASLTPFMQYLYALMTGTEIHAPGALTAYHSYQPCHSYVLHSLTAPTITALATLVLKYLSISPPSRTCYGSLPSRIPIII
jgi:hypothetical protein